MPDSYGKRNRETVKARKATARDERRIARNRRRKGLAPPLSDPSEPLVQVEPQAEADSESSEGATR